METIENVIEALPKSTVRLIGSSQVITSVVSVVKELVENSLDAGATAIDIKLENYGFDKLEVRDNGSGVKQSDTACMGLPHHTSKLTDTADLATLTTYGFRGEALGSLCAVSRVSVTTKTPTDDVSMTYELGHDGSVSTKKPSHLGQGTTVMASQLFHNIPVRRQYYSSAKRRKEELRKVEDIVIAFSVIKHDVRFSLRHDRAVLWQKNSVTSLRHSLLKVFGSSALSLMVHKQVSNKEPQCELEMYVPRPDTDCHVMSRTCADRCFIFVNHRPVIHKEIFKVLRQAYCEAAGCEGTKWPLACVSLVVPPGAVDVNLEPNKTKVLLQDTGDVLSIITRLLQEVYGNKEDSKTVLQGVNQEDQHQQALGGKVGHQDHGQMPEGRDLQGIANGIPVNKDGTPGGAVSKNKLSQQRNSDFTLPLTKPLHNSTRCDDSLNDTESMTFNILNDFDAADDLFDNIPDTANEPSFTAEFLAAQQTREVHHTEGRTEHVDNNLVGGVGLSVNSALSEQQQSIIGAVTGESVCGTALARSKADMSAGGVCRRDNISATPMPSDEIPHAVSCPDGEARQWSRGDVINSTGKKAEPVQVLLPGASFSSPANRSTSFNDGKFYDFATPESKLKHAANTPGQMTLHDVTNNSCVKRPTTAFIFFSKENRSQVVRDNPGANFQNVAKIIGERWKALDVDQRKKYEKMMTKDVERYREQIGKKGQPTNTSHKKRKLDERNAFIGDLLKSPVRKKCKKRMVIARATVSLEFSMRKLKESLQNEPSERPSRAVWPCLVGEVLPAGWWVCIQQDALMAVLPWRMRETQIYTQLMENHSVSTHSLHQPIPLSQSVVGAECWQTLVSLESVTSHQSDSTYIYLKDPRICRSGFSIRKTQETDPHVDVISMTSEIAVFGVQDLKEILDRIAQNPAVNVTDSRPLKVKQFLQGEAVRMSRQMSLRVTRDEVRDLLVRMRTETPAAECFHHRPFIHHLYDLLDLPMTQTQKDSTVLV